MDLLKKQLVTLSVELDDQTAIWKNIKRKIEEERDFSRNMDIKVPAQYEHVLRQEAEEHQKELSELIKTIKQLNNDRDALICECKKYKDMVIKSEDEIRQLKVKASEQIAVTLEMYNKQYRGHYDSRLQKQLAKKKAEVREQLIQDMKPLHQKVQLEYERELSELELKIQGEENKLRTKFQTELQEEIEREEEHVKEAYKLENKYKNDRISRQIEEIAYEHSLKKKYTQEQCQEELDKVKSYNQTLLDRDQKKQSLELANYEREHAAEIDELYQKHEETCRNIHKDFQLKLESVEKEFIDSKDRIERKLRRGEGTEIVGDGDDNDVEGGCSKMDTDQNQTCDASLEEYRQQLKNERTARIRHEIEAFHAETVKLEEEWKAAYEQNRSQLMATKENEEIGLKNHIKDCNHKITQLVADEEELLLDITRLKDNWSSSTKELEDLKEQIFNYEANIQRFKIRAREADSLKKYREQEEEQARRKQVDGIKRQIEQVENNKHIKMKEQEHLLYDIQNKHDIDLEGLEKTVKSSVAIKDKEILKLQEEISLEMNRFESLQDLLRRYNNQSGTIGNVGEIGGSTRNRIANQNASKSMRPTERSEWNNDTRIKTKQNRSNSENSSVGGTVRSSRSAGSGLGSRSKYSDRSYRNAASAVTPDPVPNPVNQRRPNSFSILTNNVNRSTNLMTTRSTANGSDGTVTDSTKHMNADEAVTSNAAGYAVSQHEHTHTDVELDVVSDIEFDDLTLATTVTGSIDSKRYKNRSNPNPHDMEEKSSANNNEVHMNDDDLVQFMNS